MGHNGHGINLYGVIMYGVMNTFIKMYIFMVLTELSIKHNIIYIYIYIYDMSCGN